MSTPRRRRLKIPPDGTVVECLGGMPGVKAGTTAIVRLASPSGHTNEGLVWLELEEPIIWSHGVSEAAGYWAGPGEFRIVRGSS